MGLQHLGHHVALCHMGPHMGSHHMSLCIMGMFSLALLLLPMIFMWAV